jgi:SPP1 family predicted phage head-tail adaptor
VYWRDTAILVSAEKTVNENGYKVEGEPIRREVFVNKKTATRSEFYAAKQAGDKIALVLEVRGVDYQDETRVEYAGKPYEVVRAYTRSGETYELNCKEAQEPAQAAQDGDGEEAGV